MSSLHLSTSEISLLSKGLNFSPTPTGFDKTEFNNDMNNLERTLSLKVHFFNEFEDETDQYKPTTLDKIRKKETVNRFNPPKVGCINTYTEAIKDEVEHCTRKHIYNT